MCIRDRLLDGEHFEPIEFEDEGMKKYLEIYRSQNWMLIGGKLLSTDPEAAGFRAIAPGEKFSMNFRLYAG